MLIRQLQNPNDYKKKVLEFDQLIDIQVQNQKNISDAIKLMKSGEPDPTQILDNRSKDDKLKDETERRIQATKNLESLGWTFNEASDIVNDIGKDYGLIVDAFPLLKESWKYDTSNVTHSFFSKSWYPDFVNKINESKGIIYGQDKSLVNDVNYIRSNLLTSSDFNKLVGKMGNVSASLFRKLNMIQDSLPDEKILDEISKNNPKNLNVIKRMIRLLERLPTKESIERLVYEKDEDGLESILSNFDEKTIKELDNIYVKIGTTANKVKREREENMRNPPGVIATKDIFNAMPYKEKQKYIQHLYNISFLKESDFRKGVTGKMSEDAYIQRYDDLYEKIIMEYEKAQRQISGQGIKYGRGIEIESKKDKYVSFGKFIINVDLLQNQDSLKLLYKSKGPIPAFRNIIPISDLFRDFIVDLLEKQKMNHSLYKMIEPKEKIIFEKMISLSGLSSLFPVEKTYINQQKELIKRFELLKGEIENGNNNKEVYKEFKAICLKLYQEGRLSKDDCLNSLIQLSI